MFVPCFWPTPADAPVFTELPVTKLFVDASVPDCPVCKNDWLVFEALPTALADTDDPPSGTPGSVSVPLIPLFVFEEDVVEEELLADDAFPEDAPDCFVVVEVLPLAGTPEFVDELPSPVFVVVAMPATGVVLAVPAGIYPVPRPLRYCEAAVEEPPKYTAHGSADVVVAMYGVPLQPSLEPPVSGIAPAGTFDDLLPPRIFPAIPVPTAIKPPMRATAPMERHVISAIQIPGVVNPNVTSSQGRVPS